MKLALLILLLGPTMALASSFEQLPEAFRVEFERVMEQREDRAFWLALMEVESNYNLRAIGDGGRAVGLFQLHEIALQDVARYDSTLGALYTQHFRGKHHDLIRFPIRQLQYALAYWDYWYSWGGIEKARAMWNPRQEHWQKVDRLLEARL